MSEKNPNNKNCIQGFQPWQATQSNIHTNYVPCTVEGCHRCFVKSTDNNTMFQTGICINSVKPAANNKSYYGSPIQNIKPKGEYL